MAALPPPASFWTEVHTIAVAWAIFFGVLAFVYATRKAPSVSETSEPEAVADQPPARPEPEARPLPEVRAIQPPTSSERESLPVVMTLPEAQALYKKGSELYAMGRGDEAMVRFDKALKLNPRLASAWAGKGHVLSARGEYQEAIRCYDEALRIDRRDAAVWHDKGSALCAVGWWEGALNCFNEALILDPRDERAWFNKGICLSNLGRHDEALPCCVKATQLDPSFAEAWQAQAIMQESLGWIQDAVAAYKQFIALVPPGDDATVERVRRHVSALEAGPQARPKPAA